MPRGRRHRQAYGSNSEDFVNLHQPTSPTRPRDVAVRRSARIAQQNYLTQQINRNSQSMADVAQRTQTSRNFRVVSVDTDYSRERRLHRQRRAQHLDRGNGNSLSGRSDSLRRRSRGTNACGTWVAGESQQPYAMDVIIQPPTNAQPGMALDPAVTVRLRSLRSYGASDSEISDINSLVAVATLTTAGTSEPVNPQILLGRRFDSVHPFPEDDGPEGRQVLGYVSFPDLAISAEGTFRIRVTLVKMGYSFGQGGSHVQAIDSQPITIMRTPSSDESGKLTREACDPFLNISSRVGPEEDSDSSIEYSRPRFSIRNASRF